MIAMISEQLLEKMKTNLNQQLLALSQQKTVFLVFLRHFGCVFCKEAMSDLANLKEEMHKRSIELVFVHMSENTIATEYFDKYKLHNIQHITDPEKEYYYAFGLREGSFTQLYGLRTWFRGFGSSVKEHKLELDNHLGDYKQMPGIFLIQDGEIIDHYVHRLASDRPNYRELMKCCKIV